MRPRLRKLRQLLAECPYNGEIYEDEVDGMRYTMDDILDVVQASETEIGEELKKLRACQISGMDWISIWTNIMGAPHSINSHSKQC